MIDELLHKKYHLNDIAYSVRASQAVLQYGVGAMVDFPDQTLMTAAPEIWEKNVKQIHDERLEKALHVDYLGMPGGRDEKAYRDGISYARFPEWYFCPKCRKFQPIDMWVEDYKRNASAKAVENDPYMTRRLRCPTCKQGLVVARIITVCEHGHIDDFPWVKWVHCKNIYGGPKEICSNPKLTFKTGASATDGLEGLVIECENCKVKTTLKGAFDPDVFKVLDEKYPNKYNFSCLGRHPWKNTREECPEYPKVLQRGSSSVYFPVTASSLVIPPYSSILTCKIEESKAYKEQRDALQAILKNDALPQFVKDLSLTSIIQKATELISLEIQARSEEVASILERKWKYSSEEEYTTSSVKYRAEEFDALGGSVSFVSENGSDFQREIMNVDDYHLPYIKKIALIHKIREVQALTGFSRINPADKSEAIGKQGHVVSVKEYKTNWYPAYEVKGEGIFIEFDSDAINQWRTQNAELSRRVDILNENYRKSFIGSHNPRTITGKFLLLHTISHLLIKQLSFECGYSIASLKERIYCSEESEGKDMSGIFIYTASGDSEGTLGGLVRQGRPDTFPNIFRKAIESAMVCSNDPVCSLSSGQGRDSLNLAACYSCGLLPETSCEEFNVFLDRGTVVGTFGNKELGFFYEQLFTEIGWKNLEKKQDHSSISTSSMNSTIMPKEGVDLSDLDYKSIWSDVKQWAVNDTEIHLLNELISRSQEFEVKEKPSRDCEFMMPPSSEKYKATLLWKKSKIAYFTSDDEDDYIIARNSDWICFCGNDANVNVDLILKKLKNR